MKKNLLLLALAGLLLSQPGCSRLLDREYAAQTPHSQFSDEEAGSDVLGAETYQGLVSAILHLISQGQETGVVRLYHYTGAAESDLDAACLEVTQQDPLGVYGVAYIQYDLSRVVSYYQADLTISYRRAPAQIAAMVSVTGNGGVENGLREALTQYRQEAVFRVSYFQGDRDTVTRMVTDAYYDVPAAALGLPQIQVELYPETGQQRVVEVLLTYPEETKTLTKKQSALLPQGEALTADLLSLGETARLEALAALIGDRVTFDPQGATNAYDALNGGTADAQGMALTVSFLCQQADLDCQVLRGTRDGAGHFWNLVQLNGVWRHLDLSRRGGGLLGDGTMVAAGYQWETAGVPVCPP